MFTNAVRLYSIVLFLSTWIPSVKTDTLPNRQAQQHGPITFNELPQIPFPQHASINSKIDLVLVKSGKHCLTVYKNKKRVWVDIPGRWHPWKLATADVDGDGKKEIIVGVYKSTRFYPFPHPCLFVYHWYNDHMAPSIIFQCRINRSGLKAASFIPVQIRKTRPVLLHGDTAKSSMMQFIQRSKELKTAINGNRVILPKILHSKNMMSMSHVSPPNKFTARRASVDLSRHENRKLPRLRNRGLYLVGLRRSITRSSPPIGLTERRKRYYHGKSSPKVAIVAVGDILLDRGVTKQIEKHGYGYPFHSVGKMMRKADIAFGNLECPLSAHGHKIDKLFCFKANPKTADCLTTAGIDIVSLANNHTLDCGKSGLTETMETLKHHNIEWCGAGSNAAETYCPKIITRHGLKVAFVGFCQFKPEAVTLTKNNPSIAMATEGNIRTLVTAARKQADIVVASFHWGIEFRRHPTDEQIHIAHLAVDCGADIVLGHHPHVLQDITTIKHGKRTALIAYSLGNFVFDQHLEFNKDRETTGILKIVVTRNGVKAFRLMPAIIHKCAPVLSDEK